MWRVVLVSETQADRRRSVRTIIDRESRELAVARAFHQMGETMRMLYLNPEMTTAKFSVDLTQLEGSGPAQASLDSLGNVLMVLPEGSTIDVEVKDNG